MIALGGDPGTGHGGLGVTERKGNTLTYLHHETITTDPKWSDGEREAFIFKRYSAVIREFHPLIFGIEDQRGVALAARMAEKRGRKAAAAGKAAPGAVGFNANSDGVIEIVGMLKGAARAYGVTYVMIQPKSVKVGVLGSGGGIGAKGQVKEAILRLFPHLKPHQLSSHGADALAISIVAGRIAMTVAA